MRKAIQLSISSRLMCGGLALSLSWILLSGFSGTGCEEEDFHQKESKFTQYINNGGMWVTCINNQPTLMYLADGVPSPLNQASNFNPQDYDCTHPNSPKYRKGAAPVYPVSTLGSPDGVSSPGSQEHRAAASQSSSAFLRQRLLALPFSPTAPTPSSSLACDPSFPDVLQTNHINALVTRISTCPFQVKARIPVVTRPLQIAITSDGSTALVTSFDNAINFIDLTTNKVTFTLSTDPSINPNGIEISSDGATAYVTSFNPFNPVVLAIDLASRKVVATIRVDAYPQGAILSPDGSQLWVTFPFGQAAYVIDTLSNTVVTRLPIRQTTDVAFNSIGTRAYVTSGATAPGTVAVVDTSTFHTIKTYTVGVGPGDIAMSYGDSSLVVNNYEGNSVSVINLVNDTVATAPIGTAPSGISFVR